MRDSVIRPWSPQPGVQERVLFVILRRLPRNLHSSSQTRQLVKWNGRDYVNTVCPMQTVSHKGSIIKKREPHWPELSHIRTGSGPGSPRWLLLSRGSSRSALGQNKKQKVCPSAPEFLKNLWLALGGSPGPPATIAQHGQLHSSFSKTHSLPCARRPMSIRRPRIAPPVSARDIRRYKPGCSSFTREPSGEHRWVSGN